VHVFFMPMMTIACTQMRMTPKAITAATLLWRCITQPSATHGSIEVGKQADLLVADVPDVRHLVVTSLNASALK
jgi:imidazolonepropionase